MAGFMSGFGSAFAQSYGDESARIAKRKDDTFRLMYEDYINRRKEREETVRKDGERVALAKRLEKAYEQPEGSYNEIYKDLSAGRDQSSIEKQLSEGRYVVRPSSVAKVTEEMEASGMIPAKQEVQTTPMPSAAPKKSNLLASLFGDKFGIPEAQRDQNAARARIAETTGDDPADIDSVMDGTAPTPEGISTGDEFAMEFVKNKPEIKLSEQDSVDELTILQTDALLAGDKDSAEVYGLKKQLLEENKRREIMAKAKADAAAAGINFKVSTAGKFDPATGSYKTVNVFEDPNNPGQYLDVETQQPLGTQDKLMDKEMSTAWDKLVDDTAKEATEYSEKAATLQSSYQEAAGLVDLYNQNPDVITKVGTYAQVIDQGLNDVKAALNLVKGANDEALAEKGEFNASGLRTIQEAEAKLQNFLEVSEQNGTFLDRNKKLATLAALFEVKATRMAYAMAAAQGQEGRSVALQEFERFMGDVRAGGNREAFLKSMDDFLYNQEDALKSKSKSINTLNSRVSNFKNRYGWVPWQIVKDTDTYVKDQKEKYVATLNAKKEQPQSSMSEAAGDMRAGPMINSEEEFNALPSGTIFTSPDGQTRRKP